ACRPAYPRWDCRARICRKSLAMSCASAVSRSIPGQWPTTRKSWPFFTTLTLDSGDIMKIVETGARMGARIEGMDLAQPLSQAAYRQIERALGHHGVIY